MSLSPQQFVQQIIDSGLMTADDIGQAAAEAPDTEQLARRLVQQKLLTAFQAQQVYAGKAKSLVLGNYVILDKLGQGGMGMVLKAQHRRMRRVVALKVLPPNVTKTPGMLARFHREVQAAARLEHPNIVAAYDADEANGTHFFVMQFVDGQDLSSLVKKKGPLSMEQAVHCVLQAAQGLEYAHKQGVIHRDIKPANLLLDAQGTVKILDMGLARIEGETGAQAELTSTGAVMGTVDYMAPEQALSTKSADARSDIYSLGVTLWYLLHARPLFDGDSLMARLIAHREFPVPALGTGRPGIAIPGRLNDVFQKMVAKQPGERYQSMTEVVAALEGALRGDPEAPSLATKASEDSQLNAFLAGLAAEPRPLTHADHGNRVATLSSTSHLDPTVTAGSVSELTDPQTSASRSGELHRPPRPPSGAVPTAWWRSRRVLIGGGVMGIVLAAVLLLAPRRDRAAGLPLAKSPSTSPATNAKRSAGRDSQREIREVLEWLRLAGGTALVHANGEEVRVDQFNTPPSGQLTVKTVDLSEAFGVSVADLGRLKVIPHEYYLQVPKHIPDGEIATALRSLPTATTVSLVNVSPVFLSDFGKSVGGHPATYLLIVNRAPQPESLAALVSMPRLESLLMSGCEMSPETFGEVAKLPRLKTLNLENSPVTDAHLAALQFNHPVELMLYGTQVTATGIADFLRRNPGCLASAGVPEDVWRQVQQRLDGIGWQGWPVDAPIPAVVPFDPQQARRHQEAWAQYLGVPVEYTNSIGMKFCLIPPGEFVMGASTEEITRALANPPSDERSEQVIRSWGPPHQVILTQPIYVGIHEVTQGQYKSVRGNNPSHFAAEGLGKDLVQDLDTRNHPVEQVNWIDAARFCVTLCQQENLKPCYSEDAGAMHLVDGTGYRLLTEAEWEFACRAGTAADAWTESNDESLQQSGWYMTNAGGRTHAVGELQANPFGLFDIHGNVWEWVQDSWMPDYYAQFLEQPAIDPSGPSFEITERVLRGGSWRYPPDAAKPSYRDALLQTYRGVQHFGFRIALPVDVKSIRRAPAAATPSTAAAIDLLQQLDVGRDVVSGTWTLENGVLQTQGSGRCSLPTGTIPDEYDLRLTVERVTPGNALVVGLVSSGQRTALIIDGFRSRGGLWGLEQVQGKGPVDNGTGASNQALEPGTPADVLVQVRKTGIRVERDGQEVIHWQGAPDALSLHNLWADNGPPRLFLGAQAQFTIRRLEFSPR